VSARSHPGPRPGDPPQGGARCPFCAEAAGSNVVETCGSVVAVPDARPVTRGHLLVIPRRHAADLFEMTAEELRDAVTLLGALRRRAIREDGSITGFNVGANCGASAGQRIMHAHIHFIPRRDGESPRRGGVKGVIRNKLAY